MFYPEFKFANRKNWLVRNKNFICVIAVSLKLAVVIQFIHLYRMSCFSANIYLFKVNSRNTKKGVKYVEVNNKNTSGVFIVNFEHVESEQVYVSLILLFLKSLIGIACPHYYSIMSFSVFVASLVNYFVLYWSSSNWFKKTIPCQFKFFDAINFSRQCIWKRES